MKLPFEMRCTKPELRSWPRCCNAACVGQTFLSASWGDFPVAPRPDWKVRQTGRLESLPYFAWPKSWIISLRIQPKSKPSLIVKTTPRRPCRCPFNFGGISSSSPPREDDSFPCTAAVLTGTSAPTQTAARGYLHSYPAGISTTKLAPTGMLSST
jgi:hypothetical protein